MISQSPTDAKPVFDTIAENAVRLCGASYGCVVRLEGEEMHLAAHHGQTAEWLAAARRQFPSPVTGDGIGGVSILDRSVVSVEDIQADARFPGSQALARTMGYRAALSVPMLRDGVAAGAILVFRRRGGRSASRRSRSSVPSPTRRSSRSRTCGCSTSWVPATRN